MIEQFYLSAPENLERACDMTELAPDEIEEIVGRFAPHSHRAGQLRGKVMVKDDMVEIRTSFGNKLLWRN